MENVEEMQVGRVTHYYTKIGVAIIDVSGSIKVGNELHIKGHTTDLRQKVESIEIEHENVEIAESGTSIGLKVEEPVRVNDLVYKRI